MSFFAKVFKHSPWRYIVAVLISIAVAVVVLIQRGFDRPEFYFDGLSAGGALTFFLGLLMLVQYLGAFDTFGYGFGRRNGKIDKDYFEYSQVKHEKRSKTPWTFCPFLTVGILFVVAGVICRFI